MFSRFRRAANFKLQLPWHRGWLKARIVFLLCWLCVLCFQGAHAITVAWDRNAEPDVIGYFVYIGPSSRQYDQRVDAGNLTELTLTNLPNAAVLYLAVTAYNEHGLESDFSEEVSSVRACRITSWLVLTNGDFQCEIVGKAGQTFVMETTTNFLDWVPVTTNVFTNGSMSLRVQGEGPSTSIRFYRASLHP